MNKKMFTKRDVRAAVRQDTDESSPLVLEHAGQWVDEGKYQYQENILRETATGKFWCYNHSKSGSHFTEYTFGFEWELNRIEMVEMHKTTKVIEVWKAVEDEQCPAD